MTLSEDEYWAPKEKKTNASEAQTSRRTGSRSSSRISASSTPPSPSTRGLSRLQASAPPDEETTEIASTPTGRDQLTQLFIKIASEVKSSTGPLADTPTNRLTAPTETDVESSPLRAQTLSPLTAESSQSSMSSMNIMFSGLSVSSSTTSIESSPITAPRMPANAVASTIGQDSSPMPYDPFSLPVAHFHQPASEIAQIDTQIPDSILAFSKSPFGTKLDANVIAHCEETQFLLDQHRIAWGTQYELARGVISGAWGWADVRSHIHELEGSNADTAWKVKAIMHGQNPSVPRFLNVWKELDREQKSINRNDGRGLGLCGDSDDSSDWYGGRIQQLGRVVKAKEGFKIVLEALENRRSHRFARYYGSRRFLQVKIPTDFLQDPQVNAEVKMFLTKKFVLCGRVYVPLHSREEGLYMIETDEDYGRNASSYWGGDEFRMSFNKFVNWHNPLDQQKNHDQAMSKYAARFALGLSSSVPALEFEERNMFFISDITTDDWQGKPNPPADKLMTDGCGFMNRTALQRIVKHLKLESVPAGVQGRIDGAKGFWILHPHDDSHEPRIWIRTSQHKIKNRGFDRAHRIFEHLTLSKPSPPSSISAQSIINLFSNNIPQQLLIKMIEEGLENEVGPFLNWNGPNAMLFLAHAINKAGNVTAARTQRLATSVNRALGLRGRDWGVEHVSANAEEELDNDDTCGLTGRNMYSGAPSSFHEMAFEMVQAGFNPQHSEYLAGKVKKIISTTIDNTMEKCRIPIAESTNAFVVPDPLGILEEGQIYYGFSGSRKNPRTDMLLRTLEGNVVLGRYPIRLPSDMQKVEAVNLPQLSQWPDVIIVSTKGQRSLASLLADGDMDGDELIAIWDPEIVQHFDSKEFTTPPPDLKENFDEDVMRVEAFSNQMLQPGVTQKAASEAFQSVLLANLSQNKVGLYSAMHDKAVIMYGYHSKEAVRLAYIFNTLVDSSKSGLRLKADVFKQDQNTFFRSHILSSPGCTSGSSTSQPAHKVDILGVLKAAGQQKGRDLLDRYRKTLRDSQPQKDADLLRPYNDAANEAVPAYKKEPQPEVELRRIRCHVDAAYALFCEALGKYKSKKESATSSFTNNARTQKGARKDIMLAATRQYAQPIDDIRVFKYRVDQLKASYAYQLSDDFGFTVAFQELCNMKARTYAGGNVATLRMFDEAKVYGASHMRILARRAEGEDD